MVLSMSRISRTNLKEACAGIREQSSSDKFLFCWVKNFSRSGKSQGILQKVRENLSSCQSQ